MFIGRKQNKTNTSWQPKELGGTQNFTRHRKVTSDSQLLSQPWFTTIDIKTALRNNNNENKLQHLPPPLMERQQGVGGGHQSVPSKGTFPLPGKGILIQKFALKIIR